MKKQNLKSVGVGALALIMSVPVFAQSRNDYRGDRQQRDNSRSSQSNRSSQYNRSSQSNGSSQSNQSSQYNRSSQSNQSSQYNRSVDSNRSYRENQRITAQGKISSFTRERDGYRVQLDRGRDSYWVPSSYFRSRGSDIRVGINVGFGGIFRGGSIFVDDVNYPNGGYYDQGLVRGVIQDVDYRAGTAFLRDDISGQTITVNLRSINERGLRRGEYVELAGSWDRAGLFDAYSVR
jgi:hypothetical protein